MTAYPDVSRPEQELSVQVGPFDGVHVSHGDVSSLSSTKAYQSKVLEKFTPNGASSNLDKRKTYFL